MRTITIVAFMTVSASGASPDTSRPDAETGPTEVRVCIVIINVDKIDDVAQNFIANVFFESQWKDSRLAHEGPGTVTRPLNDVWNPRLQIINRQRVSATLPELVEITPDGEVVYRQRLWGAYSQPLHLQDFPFDRQTFEIRLVAARYSPTEVKLLFRSDLPSGLASELSIPDWNILRSATEVRSHQFMSGLPPIEMLVLSFEADRKTGYYVLKIILPLILIVAMSWVVFWIDPTQLGTQIGVSTTTMLTLISYRFMVGRLFPKVSYLTRMDLFILASTVLVFLTLSEAVVAGVLANNERVATARSLDRWSRCVFPGAFVVLCVVAFAL